MADEHEAAITRREALTTLALGGAALVAGCAGAARVAAPRPTPHRPPEIEP